MSNLPSIPPIPDWVQGVAQHEVVLNGTWQIQTAAEGWSAITVPGEIYLQGFAVDQNREYVYRRDISIPSDFAGKQIWLRFDGVYSNARVWVNDQLAGEHAGGFTSWLVDLTERVRPGGLATLQVGVTDATDDVSFASGYAHHPIAGILRDVRLLAFPQTYVKRLYINTKLDADYRDAVLSVQMELNTAGKPLVLQFSLLDPTGAPVAAATASEQVDSGERAVTIARAVPAPLKWDAEHPYLYVLKVRLVSGEEVQSELSIPFGFREVIVAGNRMLVNGSEVKLRGVDRHDIDPVLGRTCSAELAELDVRLFKQANVNYIRTSHYPPSEAFLQACDRIGMYVEEESAVCWAGWIDNNANHEDPQAAPKVIGQFQEMVERDRNHPSIILWSLGNESRYGANIELEYQHVKAADPTRPVKFSYSDHYMGGEAKFDVFSAHYAYVEDELGSPLYPVLHDEYAHVPCYDHSELERDPNVRNVWGEGIKRFWEKLFKTDGALGGAIWCGHDEVFFPPGKSPTGYGEWGIIDVWRREKPEYWFVKKAYSPIRITEESIAHPGAGKPLHIPVTNWFDHTELQEIEFRWQAGGEQGVIPECSCAPRQSAVLELPARNWVNGDAVQIDCRDRFGTHINTWRVRIGWRSFRFPGAAGPAPRLAETAEQLQVAGEQFTLAFSKTTGLLTSGSWQGTLLLSGGPYLHLDHYCTPEAWQLSSLESRLEEKEAVVTIKGGYGNIMASFELRIDGTGRIDTKYCIGDMDWPNPGIARVPANLSEVGITFAIPASLDRVAWLRDGEWSYLPEDHIGRQEGIALQSPVNEQWASGVRTPALEAYNRIIAPITHDFKATREKIRYYSAIDGATGRRVRAEAAGNVAARIHVPEPLTPIDNTDRAVTYKGKWDLRVPFGYEVHHWNLIYANSRTPGESAELQFQADRILWVAKKHDHGGIAEVYLDGALQTEVDLYSAVLQLNQTVYDSGSLSPGLHTLKIVVTGRKAGEAKDAQVIIDRFDLERPIPQGTHYLVLNHELDYPLLGWGNAERPRIHAGKGYRNRVTVRLTDHDAFVEGSAFN